MGALSFISKSFRPVSSYLVTDSATKSTVQIFLEDAFRRTQQFLRVFSRKKNDIAINSFRCQHKLPVENFSKSTVPQNFKFLSYRPGFIQELTSKWVSQSLAGTAGKQATKKIFQGTRGPILCFASFSLAKKSSLLTSEEELEGVCYEIREAFSKIPWQNHDEDASFMESYNTKQFGLSDLKIGEMIAKGCNAAVYSAALIKDNCSETVEHINKNSFQTEQGCIHSKVFISHSEGESYGKVIFNESEFSHKMEENKWGEFNLAMKVMFNYSAESNAYAIWRAMHKETLPAIIEFSFGERNLHRIRKKNLKPHPNIVQMYFAFVDQLPLLPGAFTNYPQALPVRLLNDGFGRNMTLFLVMKRYHCNLKEYLKMYDVSTHTSLLLLTQLLEGLVHLLENEVAHRDLKTDNILLDLSYGPSFPKLVLTDFGCCLESLQLKYQTPEIEKGGNVALMAPEVVNAEPGSFSVIDYSRADLWTAGTLAYEIFGGSNPFYSPNSNLKNYDYTENTLPDLPSKTPYVVQKLIKEMLRVNPNKRPSQKFAATVCQILLHGSLNISSCSTSKDICKNIFKWMFLMSAETYLDTSLRNIEAKPIELELRHTFCSRIQCLEVLEAAKYIAQC